MDSSIPGLFASPDTFKNKVLISLVPLRVDFLPSIVSEELYDELLLSSVSLPEELELHELKRHTLYSVSKMCWQLACGHKLPPAPGRPYLPAFRDREDLATRLGTGVQEIHVYSFIADSYYRNESIVLHYHTSYMYIVYMGHRNKPTSNMTILHTCTTKYLSDYPPPE